jgi:hypothetical protein
MEVIFNDKVTTRKEHQCVGCRGIIPKGRNVTMQKIKDDTLYSSYTCEICEIVVSELEILEFYEGEVFENETDAWWAAAQKFKERTGTSHNSAIVPLKQHQ